MKKKKAALQRLNTNKSAKTDETFDKLMPSFQKLMKSYDVLRKEFDTMRSKP